MTEFVIDNTIYPLGKDLDGEVKTTKDLHDVLLDIVKEVDRVFRLHHLTYALYAGTALGLYNYGGFIPWDDDVDLFILYEELPDIVKALKEDLGPDYYFECYETNKRYNVLIPTIKIRKRNTYMKEKNILLPNRTKSGDGVFIDLVCFMGCASDYKERMKTYKYSKRRMPLYCLLDGILHIHPYHMKKKIKEHEKEVAEYYLDSPYLSQTVCYPFLDWSKDKNKKKLYSNRADLLPVKEYMFEGVMLYSFNNLKQYCIDEYGEKSLRVKEGDKWVDPYPENRRSPHHLSKYSLTREKVVKK
ncbi:MAG: LicD family protein [Coprobacillus sp.]|nr:LicD family protein [Coprobacillus sp.]